MLQYKRQAKNINKRRMITMSQNKINNLNDVDGELLYNSLFGTPCSLTRDKLNGRTYVAFSLNHNLAGENKKLQIVDYNAKEMSNILQSKKARFIENLLLDDEISKVLYNEPKNAKEIIRDNIELTTNFLNKFDTMVSVMISNLKPEIKEEFVKNFADNIQKLHNYRLLGKNAINYASEKMLKVDNSFRLRIQKNTKKKVDDDADAPKC